MKTMKKFASLALAMIMALALAIPAFAEGADGTITVQNAANGETYYLYKVFDAKVSEDREDAKADGITYYGKIPAGLTEVFTAVQDPATNGTIRVADGKTDKDVIDALTDWAKAQDPNTSSYLMDSQTASGGAVVFEGLDEGYYVVISDVSNAGLITVTSITPDAVVYDKNERDTPEYPDDAKKAFEVVNDVITDNEKTSFELGDQVGYTVTINTQNWDGAGEDAKRITKYTVVDTSTQGYLSINENDVTVTINDEAPTQAVTTTINGNVMTIEIPWGTAEASYYDDGAEIVISYIATVTGTGKGTNSVHTTYDVDGVSKDIPEDPDENIYNTTVVIDKYTGELEGGERLAGAEFVLMNDEGKYYSISNNVVVWLDAESDGSVPAAAIVTTDEDGAASFEGLENGTYTLVEVKAPEGYNLANNIPAIVINASDANQTVSVTAPVLNNVGAVLPSTGGIGTTIFYVGGGILVAGAAILLITKKRMGAAD